MEARQTRQLEDDPPVYETCTRATVVFDERMHIIMTGSDYNDEFYEEALMLNGKQYERYSPDGRWKELPIEFDVDNMLTLDAKDHFQMVDGPIDQTIAGREILRGVEVAKVAGRFDMEKRARNIWDDPHSYDPKVDFLFSQLGSPDVLVYSFP